VTLRIVDSMHERKALMADLADAFVALPGGLGTLEEFCEMAGASVMLYATLLLPDRSAPASS